MKTITHDKTFLSHLRACLSPRLPQQSKIG